MGNRSAAKAVNRKIKGAQIDMNLSELFLAMDAVLSGKPGSPRIIAAPVVSGVDDNVIGCILTLNLNVNHDPKIAIHFKALMERLLEIEGEPLAQTQMMRNAIAACKSSDEAEIKIL
jgi:hypothetical protein